MKAVLSRFCAVALAISTAVAVTPAMAAPGGSLRDMAQPSDARLILVDGGPEVTGQTNSGRAAVYRGGGYRGHHYRGHRSYGRHYRGHSGGYYYRRHNNGAGIAAGLITGAIVGGVIANSGRGYSGGSAHARWCYDRYRSYRASDNTFQPYNGPRRQCVSPY